jgi:putative spermidine/putrescine transport system substrate-binding protein/spermidine/putrescine transport system substrate-binding protein
MAAQLLGMDDPKDRSKLYNLTDVQLAQVKAKLVELKPRIRTYWSTAGDLTQLFQAGEVIIGEGWPLMTNQLRRAKFPAGEVIPKEGTTAWADHWVVTSGAQNLDAAYAWLEYGAQPFTHKLLADVTGYIVANPAAKRYMTPDEAAGQHDVAEYGAKVNFWQWGPRRDKYQEVWNEVKAAQ